MTEAEVQDLRRDYGVMQTDRNNLRSLLDGTEAKVDELHEKLEDAEAEAKALRARVADLEAALKPFSDIAGEMFARNWNKEQIVLALDTPERVNRLTFDDFLAARAALQQEGGE